MPLKNCSLKYRIFNIWFFCVNMDITSWIIFVCLKYIGLDLDFLKTFFLKTPPNINELQHMKYICDEIILVTKYEKLHTYFKTRVVGGIFGEIFCGQWYYIHQLNLGSFGGLKFLVEISLKICVFFMFFNNKRKIIYVFKEKTNIKWKINKFYSWALHYFFRFFLFSNVLWTTNMRPYGRQKITDYICCVNWFYSILFI